MLFRLKVLYYEALDRETLIFQLVNRPANQNHFWNFINSLTLNSRTLENQSHNNLIISTNQSFWINNKLCIMRRTHTRATIAVKNHVLASDLDVNIIKLNKQLRQHLQYVNKIIKNMLYGRIFISNLIHMLSQYVWGL